MAARKLRWLDELVRHNTSARQVYLYGNVEDHFPDADTYSGLSAIVERVFFDELGYGLVGTYDPLDGLTFRDQSAIDTFGSILAARGRTAAAREPRERPNGRLGFDPLDETLRDIRRAVGQKAVACAFVFDFAGLLAVRPDGLSDTEVRRFLMLAKACREAGTVTGRGEGAHAHNNLTILVVRRLADLPLWLYVGNPLGRAIQVDLPGEAERESYFRRYPPGSVTAGLAKHLAELTHGLMTRELSSLYELAQAEALPLDNPEHRKALVDLYKLGRRENPWEQLTKDIEKRRKLSAAADELGERVKGQGPAINRAVDILKRASQGLSGVHHVSKARQPKGVLFFAGPTGVGKTELAKGIARLLFGDEERCLRFDMSEYSQEHSEMRLFGAPPSYVGFEAGGQLTNAVKANPFSVLLFDEIEKAHPKIMDKFLQILDDGRMTSGQGETVYFSECLLIFTSNIGIVGELRGPLGNVVGREQRLFPWIWECAACGTVRFAKEQPTSCAQSGCEGRLDSRPARYDEIADQVRRALAYYFQNELGRPEIYNRFGDNFIIFDFIREAAVKEIVLAMLERTRQDLLRRRALDVDFAEVVDYLAHQASKNRELGGRGVGNALETILINPMARKLWDDEARLKSATRIKVTGIYEHVGDEGSKYEVEWLLG